MNEDSKMSPPYSVLAKIYDAVMSDVNYGIWADFIDEIIQFHNPGARKILELACGTGELSLTLDEIGYYDITATDKSVEMINKAQKKADHCNSTVRFSQMDFLDIHLEDQFDVVILTFDSINYLHRDRDIQKLLKEVKKVIINESLFIYDFTTPRNSIKAIQHLNNEEGFTEEFRYFRQSSFDPAKKIHQNEFRIEKLDADGKTVLNRYFEVHKQKIYSLPEMLDIISDTDYNVLAKYEGFELKDADNKSLRITMVLQCPTIL